MKAATRAVRKLESCRDISIHAAREGGDLIFDSFIFHLTISIHAAREGGDYVCNDKTDINAISIHAAREGGDFKYSEEIEMEKIFQSTPPVKAATSVRR